jgi:HD superfamily phosphohydrolase
MSAAPYWSDIYNTFGSLFYDLIGFYELQFNRDPTRMVEYDKIQPSSEVLPIYGESALPRYAMYLCQLPLVNRLTEIKQLAYTCVLFPGATHTRYEHSRGVMHKGASLLYKIKKGSKKKNRGITVTNDDKVVLDIAALLHDLGHPAWGHALDGITGYVVQLFREIDLYLFSPRKLDITITLYLLLENAQLRKALSICSREVKNKKLRELFDKVIAQIIMEEEWPLFPGI